MDVWNKKRRCWENTEDQKKLDFFEDSNLENNKMEHKEEIKEKIQAQKDYCKKNGVPFFAPENGKCWNCRNQIFNRYSLEEAGNHIITGCPYCHRSYCD